MRSDRRSLPASSAKTPARHPFRLSLSSGSGGMHAPDLFQISLFILVLLTSLKYLSATRSASNMYMYVCLHVCIYRELEYLHI